MTKLELIDARIKEVESTLVYLLHERLALVNKRNHEMPTKEQIDYEAYERRCKELD